MLKKGYVSRKELICPCVRSDSRPAGRKYDYFYFPPSPGGNQTMVVCDYGNNHRDGSRNVVFADGSVRRLSPADFQAELADPANAAFAEALRQAEGEAAPAPVGRE